MRRVGLIFLLSLQCSAGIIAHAPIPVLEKQADGIVVGEVESVQSAPTQSFLSIRIVRVIKGEFPSSSVVASVEGPVLDGQNKGSTGLRLWFLKERKILPRIYNLFGIDGYSFPAASSESVQKLAAETFVRGLHLEFLSIGLMNTSDAGSRGQLSHYFATLPDKERVEVDRVFRQRRGETRNDDLMIGILLKRSAREGLERLVESLRSSTGSTTSSHALCEYRNPDPVGIRLIADLVREARDSGTVTCALVALKAIHTRSTIQPLASMLDAGLPEQRYLAVAGLYHVANSGNVPNEEPLFDNGREVPRSGSNPRTEITGTLPPFELFTREQQTHLTFWRQWAAAQPEFEP
jgi:hypothetical protein